MKTHLDDVDLLTLKFVTERVWGHWLRSPDWEHRDTITAGSARELLNKAATVLCMDAPSMVNPIFTNRKGLDIMIAGIANIPDESGIPVPTAYNIVTLCSGRRCHSIPSLRSRLYKATKKIGG